MSNSQSSFDDAQLRAQCLETYKNTDAFAEEFYELCRDLVFENSFPTGELPHIEVFAQTFVDAFNDVISEILEEDNGLEAVFGYHSYALTSMKAHAFRKYVHEAGGDGKWALPPHNPSTTE